jgi:CRISPR/Cas system-associated protein Cas10 (large subunit of type III CRISPR-Cas system)
MSTKHMSDEVTRHLDAVAESIKENLKEQASSFQLSLKRGELSVDLEMDPVDGKVRLNIRQYYPETQHDKGGETKRGFTVNLNINELPELKPGYEFTHLIPEKRECSNCPVDPEKIPF